MTVVGAFRELVGGDPALLVRSPGRVNLLGEHTDYNDGWVLPAALDLGTDLAAGLREDGMLRAAARRLGEEDRRPLGDLRPREAPEWARYVRGMAALLPDLGVEVPGADLVIGGDLPLRSGLSSSASLEIGVGLALCGLARVDPDRRELARMGQRVENEIVGVQSGIMDQLVIAFGEEGRALLIDCRSLELEGVPIPAGVRVLVLDTAVPRTLAASAYNRRRAECQAAVRALRRLDPRVRSLRDVTAELLQAGRDRMGEVEHRRARHVVTENARVERAASALRAGDPEEVGRLMVASHLSLRDDYQVSGPGLDLLVEIALGTPGVLGARLTGAGFGGCVVALVEAEGAVGAARRIADRYRATSGREGWWHVCLPGAGARVGRPGGGAGVTSSPGGG